MRTRLPRSCFLPFVAFFAIVWGWILFVFIQAGGLDLLGLFASEFPAVFFAVIFSLVVFALAMVAMFVHRPR